MTDDLKAKIAALRAGMNAKIIVAHIARCTPETIKDILDALEADEAKVKELGEENDSLMDHFAPCVSEWAEAGCTEMILEDAPIFWVIWQPEHGNSVDLGYNAAGQLIGVKMWGLVKTRASARPQEG
jgi:hypothetical protein